VNALRACLLALALLFVAWPAALAGQVSGWIESEGSAEIAGGTTNEQARVNALNKARTQAIAQVTGITISDEAMMSRSGEGALKLFRETRALVAGRVVEEKVQNWSNEFIQSRPEEPGVPVVRVKLLVKVATDDPADLTFKVQLALNKRRYSSGEPVVMNIRSSQNAYAMVFSLGADDKVRLVVPNDFRADLPLQADRPVSLPDQTDLFDIRPMPVAGHTSDAEAVKVVATRTRVAAPPADPKAGTISMASFYRWLLAIPARDRAESTAEYAVFASGDVQP
jgi:hypothetical protein